MSLMYKLFGISGSNGSGKDTLGHLLEDRYEFKFISVSDMLREEAARRGMEPNRKNLHVISAEWRREGGLGVLIDRAVELYEKTYALDHVGLALASLRNPGEVDKVHERGGKVVWVDADPEIRYARIQFASRGRDDTDNLSFEKFMEEEAFEMQPTGDEATLNMQGVKDKCDFTLFNNSTELDHFIRTIDESFKPYLEADS